MFFNFNRKTSIPDRNEALPGRTESIPILGNHFMNGRSMIEPYPQDSRIAMFGGGCFWGVERKFWQLDGVHVTAVGYSGGYTPNPTYREVCSGMTGHNEVVRVVFMPDRISYESLLQVFWECHDPTQGMRQGNDVGTQYRSGIYTYGSEQKAIAVESLQAYSQAIRKKGYGAITTEIVDASEFYFAEAEHQQYLGKNPHGYCGLGGTGVCYVPTQEPVSASA
ncbi:MAG: peptide-methionine (S)-S-oxide reductase MsrA [Acidiferrobacterales bacterium]|nr:peptide-methionine (S)-S-oxide reductase MsrA [Acidiferrobacterales bacterium]